MLRKLSLAFMAALLLGACQSGTGPDLMFYNPDGESDEVTIEASVPETEIVAEENDSDGSF